jgi:hypothetical protein
MGMDNGPIFPAGARSIIVSCPSCRQINDIAVDWDLSTPAPGAAPTDPETTLVPVEISCANGHQWRDSLDLDTLTLLAERAYLPGC